MLIPPLENKMYLSAANLKGEWWNGLWNTCTVRTCCALPDAGCFSHAAPVGDNHLTQHRIRVLRARWQRHQARRHNMTPRFQLVESTERHDGQSGGAANYVNVFILPCDFSITHHNVFQWQISCLDPHFRPISSRLYSIQTLNGTALPPCSTLTNLHLFVWPIITSLSFPPLLVTKYHFSVQEKKPLDNCQQHSWHDCRPPLLALGPLVCSLHFPVVQQWVGRPLWYLPYLPAPLLTCVGQD